MSDGKEEGLNIQEDLLKEFDVYDTTVDIVCCWEAFINHSYDGKIDSYYFDRFPHISHPEGYDGDLTPDFTICFNQEYAIIGEIKRTFPEEDEHFQNEMEQILTYDNSLQVEMGDGSEGTPETIDILLLIEGTDAPQISHRINELREEKIIEFDNNFLMFRYNFNQTSTISRYEFQKVIEASDFFRDDTIPDDVSLSNKFDEERKTAKVYPKHFRDVKFEKPICNDSPPPIYLATILWHKLFANQISNSEYREWQWGSAQKTKLFTVEPYEFTRKVNNRFKECDGEIRVRWIKEAFNFLCEADLADYNHEEETYEIKYRDFNIRIGEEESYQDGLNFRKECKELTYKLSNRYEKKIQEKKEKPEREAEGEYEEETEDEAQSSLTDFNC
ncbi:MAG: hypothetical protein ABEK17_00030 [Candidatus Aenigmatarchaeota archaeon]